MRTNDRPANLDAERRPDLLLVQRRTGDWYLQTPLRDGRWAEVDGPHALAGPAIRDYRARGLAVRLCLPWQAPPASAGARRPATLARARVAANEPQQRRAVSDLDFDVDVVL